MRKKEAIKILRNLIKENKNENSLIKIRSYISDFFGKDSPEYKHSETITYSFKSLGIIDYERNIKTQYNENQVSYIFYKKENEINEFLNNCIETIENKGLCKKTKTNLLSELNNLQLIVMFFGLFVSTLGLGVYLSKYKFVTDLLSFIIGNT